MARLKPRKMSLVVGLWGGRSDPRSKKKRENHTPKTPCAFPFCQKQKKTKKYVPLPESSPALPLVSCRGTMVVFGQSGLLPSLFEQHMSTGVAPRGAAYGAVPRERRHKRPRLSGVAMSRAYVPRRQGPFGCYPKGPQSISYAVFCGSAETSGPPPSN